ncbi:MULTISPECIES: hypothetical protein [unclassified Streptomyces]|uniref:hypothetical protein n=1 Tax=unclassified Streptomyces TaxID=2593676 RepID=UPI000DB918B9|nr:MULTISPECIES: hypothetical protein [unclassified Streptomyces]MYT73366.1 hypothetical protein [Streptomyces sp. SID8367]RAJ70584.1 hypothetical protein K377_07923 [Streptomyces sp. PsTaAH-137]
MTTSTEPSAYGAELASGKFVDYTHVLWMDIILNITWLLAVIGLLSWITWGFLERRHGIRGAVRRHDARGGRMPGRRVTTRTALAVLSVAGSSVQLGFGIALWGRSGEQGDSAGLLVISGGLCLAVWLFAGVFWRPRKWRAVPEEATGGPAEDSEESDSKEPSGRAAAGADPTEPVQGR